MNKKQIEVVAAVLINGGQFLAVQRGESKLSYVSKKWEFPGGKVEAGETLVAAITRELEEELRITIAEPQFLLTVEHSYPDFDITMHCFVVNVPTRELELTEHLDSRWLNKEQLWDLDWAAADVPAVEMLSVTF
ncbi:(deoxy)nucleoside triphosphate pyrophosphohydrolase [Photobacterium damselae]|uniref:(deoxy)nucleoside triphosphate pyrophosphohydrolase n=1 Tax=Photobacterium damselae TaxID=38293 RepID=UPI00083B959E|nr:(deoxy)nucleoside triphosphate pyrophosphohydrolase [Photobacterium damselae]KAB1181398.1 (deoxy)nucleoside triphosphate pyrophosphohydrolase [Photobacterium damselae subsp. damselae]MBF7101357.1 (deoxy)nucleoside triphosphate pyrophosphohydrolase [Photobacterium damselae]NVO74183.1 (deoxy)nucleoside triphosphate pyrophosphohydrolase [Photobacterium damselae subsp. damselae]PSB82726.1 (deoxy)nucleoside triphosphate pyrophosphohydrolase [Photobacterium damselae subsp. damselae]QSH58950.1 (de